jgi:NAD+ kinase
MPSITLGLMGNPAKLSSRAELQRIVDELRRRGASFVLDRALAVGVGFEAAEVHSSDDIMRLADLILSFGGDGTLLRTAQSVGQSGKPILGVNPGPGLGYLTELKLEELPGALDPILNGKFAVEERMMLAVNREGDDDVHYSLNDVIVGHSPFFRTMRIEVMIDGSPVTTYRCDGLVVATPTGSTAYTLSAGGPIVEPTLNVMVVTPICPHTLTMRPVVISSKRTVQIRPEDEAILAADGESVMPLKPHDVIRVACAPYRTRIANVSGRDFYDVLSAKLQWGAAGFEPFK